MIERFVLPVALAAFGFVAAWCFFSGHIALGVAAVLVIAGLIIRLNKAMLRTDSQVRLLLEAVKNSDTSLRFSSNDSRVTRSLNEIAAILHRVRLTAAESERTYSLILSAVSAGVIVIDSKGYVNKINEAALSLLALEVLTHTDRLQALNPDFPAMLRNARAGARLQLSLPAGMTAASRNVVIMASEAVIADEHLKIFVMDDIAGELESREIESWSKLTRVLVHEIINSLTPVTSISRTILSSPEIASLPPHIHKGLDTIGSMSEGLTDFVNSFRALTSPPKVNPSLMELRPFLEKMVMAARSASPAHIEIKLQECDSDLMVYADAALTGRVVTNILSNAVSAVDHTDNPLITVSARCEPDDSVIIDIADNGPAIDPATAESIFIPFFTTRPDGQGIGLPLCRQIMKAQGGSVTLRPYGESSLTVFRISFF